MQSSRCVQRRKPRMLLPSAASFSAHGAQGPRQRQHVLDVYASGVGATAKRFDSLRIRPTPMHGGLPRLHAAPGRPFRRSPADWKPAGWSTEVSFHDSMPHCHLWQT